MAAKYWVGGTGTWSQTTHWSLTSGGASGAAVPTASDDVIFDGNSGTGSYTVTVAVTPTAPLSITINNTTNSNSDGNISISTGVILGVQASATLTRFTQSSTQGTFTVSGLGRLDLNCGVTISNPSIFSCTVTSLYNSGALSQWNFNNCSMSSNIIINTNGMTLTGNLTTTGSFTHTNNGAGPVTITGYTLSVGSAVIGGTSLAATYNFGSTGVFNVTGTSGTVLQVNNAYTPTGSNAYLNITGGGSTARSIAMGAAAGANVNVTSGTFSLTLSTASGQFNDLNFTGFSGTLVGDATASTILGTLTLSSTMTVATGTGAITLSKTASTSTVISFNSVTFNRPLTLSGADATSNFSFSTSPSAPVVGGTLTLAGGTLDITNYTLTVQSLAISGATTKVIAFGTSGKFYITAPGAGQAIFTNTGATNHTFTGTSNITVDTADTGTKSLNATGSTATNAYDFYFIAGTYTLSIVAASIFNTFDTTGSNPTIPSVAFSVAGNFNISSTTVFTAGTGTISFVGTSKTQNITTNGVTIDRPVTVNGSGLIFNLIDSFTIGSTRAFTFTLGTLTLNANLTAGSFVSTNTNTRAINFVNGAIVITGSGVMWNVTCTYTGGDVITVTGAPLIFISYSGATASSITSSTATNALAETNALNFSISYGTYPLTVTGIFGGLDFRGDVPSGQYSGALALTSAPIIFGGLAFSNSMTVAGGTGIITLKSSSTQYVITNGITIGRPITCSGTGTYTLLDSLTMDSTATSIFTLTSGTVNLNSNMLTTIGFTTSGTTARSLSFNNGTVVCTGSTATAWNASGSAFTMSTNGFISMTGSAAKTFVGGCFSYPVVSQDGAGVLTFSGASYYQNLKNTVDAVVVPTAILYAPLTATATITIAAPAVFTVASGSSPPSGAPVVFTTTGALPTGLTAGTVYYVYNTGATTFNVAARIGDAINGTNLVATSGTQSGTHTATFGNTFNNLTLKGLTGTAFTTFGVSTGTALTATAAGIRPGMFITGSFGTVRIVSGSGSSWVITPSTVFSSTLITGSNNINLASATDGTKHYLASPNKVINSVQYISIKDSQAVGAASWYASTESNNVGNNTGWFFGTATTNFLMFM